MWRAAGHKSSVGVSDGGALPRLPHKAPLHPLPPASSLTKLLSHQHRNLPHWPAFSGVYSLIYEFNAVLHASPLTISDKQILERKADELENQYKILDIIHAIRMNSFKDVTCF